MQRKQHLFGPVPSRRLGRSLGVDLIPYKTCTQNCVYCECGKTTMLTAERKEYISFNEIIGELEEFLSDSPELDFITLGGSGEPTLHSRTGELISTIKEKFPGYKVAIITNSTLFHDVNVRKEVLMADVILPSLDAVSDEVFMKINRPVGTLNIYNIIEGLIKLRKEFQGKIWLEIFIIPGINDSTSELNGIKKAIEKIQPDKIQINTLDRPGTEPWVKTATQNELKAVADFLESTGIEIISGFSPVTHTPSFSKNMEKTILATILRRPCTTEDLSHIIGLDPDDIKKYLKKLLISGKITAETEKRGIFYRMVDYDV